MICLRSKCLNSLSDFFNFIIFIVIYRIHTLNISYSFLLLCLKTFLFFLRFLLHCLKRGQVTLIKPLVKQGYLIGSRISIWLDFLLTLMLYFTILLYNYVVLGLLKINYSFYDLIFFKLVTIYHIELVGIWRR